LRQQAVRDRAVPEIGSRARTGGGGQPSPGDRQFVRLLLERCDDLGVQIAVMHLIDGVPQVDVAESLGISRRTVFNRIKRIERIAADLLDADEPARPPAPVRQAAARRRSAYPASGGGRSVSSTSRTARSSVSGSRGLGTMATPRSARNDAGRASAP